jgi:hypothetical protein
VARAANSDLKKQVEEVGKQVDRAVRKAGPYIENIARFGIAARGVTYLLLGGLATLAAIGLRGRMASTGGMLEVLIGRPIGWIIFMGLAVGFGGFGFWQWVRAIRDPDRVGKDWPAIGKRLAWFWSGIVNFTMVFLAIRIAMSGRSRDFSGDSNAQSWVKLAMQYPLGRWAVAGTGAGMIIYGISEIVCATRMDPNEMLHRSELSPRVRGWVCWIGRFGIMARGIVFALIGMFLMLAAWYQQPRVAKGQGGVLNVLEHQQYGPALLAVVAGGLIAYGGYALVLARYRRIRTD